MSFNKVILLGNLTRDPEVRHTSGDQAVANIGVAVNRRFKTKEGENREETTFVDCEAWGRLAEVIGQYFSKGKPIMIEGRLKLDQWTDQNGQNRSKHKVVIENFSFVGGPGEGGSGGGGGKRYENSGQPVGAGSSNAGSSNASSSNAGSSITEDDIPF